MFQQEYKQLSEQVADKIRALISDGTIKPGEWLRQEHLAQAVGVSPTPFREAVKVLVAEGLLEHLPYRGVRVVQFNVNDIEDIYSVRAHMESLAAREAAMTITDKELKALDALQSEMQKRLAPEHIHEYRKLNMRFHELVYTASRRTYLIRALNQLWALTPSMLWGNFPSTASNPLPERTANDPSEHEAILRALHNHDPEEAERTMRNHIEGAGRQLLESIRR